MKSTSKLANNRAHQVVLASGSEYFYELFKEKSKEEFFT